MNKYDQYLHDHRCRVYNGFFNKPITGHYINLWELCANFPPIKGEF